MNENVNPSEMTATCCRAVTLAMSRAGVRRVVVSPGSRNAAMVVEIERSRLFSTAVVIDEREAGFYALGQSLASGGEPVAIVCTSGTAVLNYAPAIAEAYYRGVPLVAVSCDRPRRWIDQNDSQTIRQAGSLCNIVKAECDISDLEYALPDGAENTFRAVEVILKKGCLEGRRGPVHINLHLEAGEPRHTSTDIPFDFRSTVSDDGPAHVVEEIPRSVMVVAGGMLPDSELSEILSVFAEEKGWLVIKEAQSNLKSMSSEFLISPEAALTALGAGKARETDLVPELVISVGGPLVSVRLKEFLRRNRERIKFWRVGKNDKPIDTFMRLDKWFDVDETRFFKSALERAEGCDTALKTAWLEASAKVDVERFAESAPWCDFKAVREVLGYAPEGIHLQVSNGMSIRYTQWFQDYEKFKSVHCNRGVSGIEGSTSTAIGFASVAGRTLLITGDMSAAYDVGALALPGIPDDFKIVIINNSGGEIFRMVATTRNLPERERDFALAPRFPIEKLAEAYGLDYFEAGTESELEASLPKFFENNTRPSILNIITPPGISAETFLKFISK